MFNKIKDKNLKELLKESSFSFLLKSAGMLCGYLSMLFVTNFHGAKEWGVFSLCFTLLSVFVLIPKFGFDNSLVRIIAEMNVFKNYKGIVNVLLKGFLISLILSGFVITVVNLFSDFLIYEILKKQELKSYISTISYAIIPIVCLTLIGAYFQALKKTMLFILFQTSLINFVFLVFLMALYYLNFNIRIFEIYLLSVFISFLAAIVFIVFHLKKIKVETPVKGIEYNYKKIINISFPMLLSSSFALFMGWSDIVMLSFYRTTTEIGIYDSVIKLATISTISLMAINSIATPKFVEFYTNRDMLGLQKTVNQSTKMIFITSAPILLVLIVFSKQILNFFGEEFILGQIALVWLCISRFINAISGSVGYIMQMTDQQNTYQRVIIIAFIINFILNFVLIPQYGLNGAALASSIAMIFWNLTLVLIIKKNLGFWTLLNFKNG